MLPISVLARVSIAVMKCHACKLGGRGWHLFHVVVPLPPMNAALDEAGEFSYTEKKNWVLDQAEHPRTSM